MRATNMRSRTGVRSVAIWTAYTWRCCTENRTKAIGYLPDSRFVRSECPWASLSVFDRRSGERLELGIPATDLCVSAAKIKDNGNQSFIKNVGGPQSIMPQFGKLASESVYAFSNRLSINERNTEKPQILWPNDI